MIWIAFEKNKDNDKCLFGLLPKDIIVEIIKFFKSDLGTDYHDYIDPELDKDKDKDLDRNDGDVDLDLDQLSKEKLIQRIMNVIEQASSKGVCKNKIIQFLIDQDETTENDIYIAYNRYYEKNVCTCSCWMKYICMYVYYDDT